MTFSLSCFNAENNDASGLAQHVLNLSISLYMNESGNFWKAVIKKDFRGSQEAGIGR